MTERRTTDEGTNRTSCTASRFSIHELPSRDKRQKHTRLYRMDETKILLQKVTPIPRRKAGDLHFPRELVYLCKISFGADVEILAGQAAAMAPKKSLTAQPKFQTKQHSILLRYRFWDTSSGIMCRRGGEPVTEVLCSTALVLWNAIKIIVSNPLLLILAIISIARRKLRS